MMICSSRQVMLSEGNINGLPSADSRNAVVSFWPKIVHNTVRCVEVLRPSQPNGVMSSAVSLPNHTFTGQAFVIVLHLMHL